MNDKISFVPENVRETVENTADSAKNELKKGFKETLAQIFGINSTEVKRNEEQTKKLAEKAEKSGKTIEEQAKIEALRKQLHAQVTAPRPTSPDQPTTEEEDKVGTNETMQSLRDNPNQSNANSLPPLAQPSMRHGERLKIRE